MSKEMDPTKPIALPDIMKKLQEEDPSRFRDMMSLLQYEGKNPEWTNQTAAQASNTDNMDEAQLQKAREALCKELNEEQARLNKQQ